MKALAIALVVAVGACASPDDAPTIEKVRPPWGPMIGGSTVEVLGRHFDPYVNRVYIGGREASVVRTIDDQHLEVVIPPGDHAGDAEVVVVTPSENVIATGLFRYSAPPAIESVTPSRVLLSAPPTLVTIHGSGFVDEEAGDPLVIVNGQLIPDIDVRDDSTIRFEAPPGLAFTRAEIEVINLRGGVTVPGFRYAITDRPGLLAFGLNSGAFAVFWEPATETVVSVPELPTNNTCIYGVIGDGAGGYWVSDYCALGNWGFGRLDLATQQVVDGIVTGRLYPTMTHHRGTRYAIEYSSNRFGMLSSFGDTFTQIGTTSFSCCDFGLASDETTMWLVARDAGSPAIRTIDPETGALGPSVVLVPSVAISDLRWFDGLLYATTSNGDLVTIDPPTGAVTTLLFVGNSYALEVFE